MQVLTLDNVSFGEHAARLAGMVASSAPPRGYDAIVGIRRGGSIVCDAFCRHFPASMFRMRADVTLQRPSTGKKTGLVARILKSLPLPLLDAMRMAEARWLSLRGRHRRPEPLPDVPLPPSLRDMLERVPSPAILLIDDAIDSGRTILAVKASLLKANPRTVVSTAVMTVTTADPEADADCCIYHNKTLIRFPWSNDYKK